MVKLKSFILVLVLIVFSLNSGGQDLMDELDSEVGEYTEYAAYTFKSTRILNGHSIERMQEGQLDFRINHRFGELNSGAYELWGLDNALISFSLEYGITDWVMAGLRRSTFQKTYDGFTKFTVLRQSTGAVNMPFSLTYLVGMALPTIKYNDPTREDLLKHRLSFTHQIPIARKFNEALSLQITPSYVHYNQVDEGWNNDVYAIGFGGTYKFARRVALMFEYFYSSEPIKHEELYNPFSVGFDIETGGHVFQLFACNSKSMIEKDVVGGSFSSWGQGEVFFGFNISRVFAVKKSKNH